MARMSSYELSRITDKILLDLYGKQEEKLNKQKLIIAEKNREYFIEPLIPFIEKLPIALFRRELTHQTIIKYKLDKKDPKAGICHIWEYKCKDKFNYINLPTIYARVDSENENVNREYVSNLDSRLYDETAKLCEEIITLRAERRKMKKYLDETTTKYSGSKQLRKIWPHTLHKYLPAEVLKSTPKKIEIEQPDFINTRLTNNLLEGA